MNPTLTTQQINDWTMAFDADPHIPSYAKQDSVVREHMLQGWLWGQWLAEKLEEVGFGEKERNNICFAFGQQCAMAKPGSQKGIAAKMLEQAIAGNPAEPGPALAREISDRCLDIQPDGIYIHPQTEKDI